MIPATSAHISLTQTSYIAVPTRGIGHFQEHVSSRVSAECLRHLPNSEAFLRAGPYSKHSFSSSPYEAVANISITRAINSHRDKGAKVSLTAG